jgi:EAL domain-containing protein (putative c-di-GMP-specific phosphodiesterase class I)/CheY-like chemotaxis protein
MAIQSNPQFDLHAQIRQQGVLVVDDSRVQRGNVIELLRQFGISKIYEADDGNAALEVVRNLFQPPAIVLLDLELPGKDGIELVQQFALENFRPRLIVASSADSSLLRSVETLILELGLPLLGAIQKPITEITLMNALDHFSMLASAISAAASSGDSEVGLSALRGALDQGLIGPYYQPKVSLSTGEMSGLEALARWRNPDGSLIPPSSFISVAENNDLVGCITLTMLDKILSDLSNWHLQNFFPVVALNVSAKSLSDRDFANEVLQRVDASGISPRSLVLELTESAVVTDIAAAIGTLGRMRLKGFGLSIDDYGTGFSSMQQLSRLPFTELKIDQSFVRHANEKWNLRVILESAITIGHRLGLATVAEGIETEEELKLLAAIGCRYAQGYLLAKPMPARDIMDWRKRETPRLQELCRASTVKLPDND